jgi:hypothetical protein
VFIFFIMIFKVFEDTRKCGTNSSCNLREIEKKKVYLLASIL